MGDSAPHIKGRIAKFRSTSDIKYKPFVPKFFWIIGIIDALTQKTVCSNWPKSPEKGLFSEGTSLIRTHRNFTSFPAMTPFWITSNSVSSSSMALSDDWIPKIFLLGKIRLIYFSKHNFPHANSNESLMRPALFSVLLRSPISLIFLKKTVGRIIFPFPPEAMFINLSG